MFEFTLELPQNKKVSLYFELSLEGALSLFIIRKASMHGFSVVVLVQFYQLE